MIGAHLCATFVDLHMVDLAFFTICVWWIYNVVDALWWGKWRL